MPPDAHYPTTPLPVSLRLLSPVTYEALRLHTQRVRHPRDVVEVGDHLRRVVDRRVIQSVRTQRVEIFYAGGVLVVREFGRVLTQRAIGLRQRRVTPIARHGVHQRIRAVGA